jgi:hypothetical protein
MTLALHARVMPMSCEAFRHLIVLLFVVGSKAAAYVCLKLGVDKPSVCARLSSTLSFVALQHWDI